MLRFVVNGPDAIKSPTRVILRPCALTFRKPKPRVVSFTCYRRLNFNVDFFSFIVVLPNIKPALGTIERYHFYLAGQLCVAKAVKSINFMIKDVAFSH
jgi:hypothetical protein